MSQTVLNLTCLCNNCSEILRFSAHAVDTEILCPACGMPTRLYRHAIPIPPAIQSARVRPRAGTQQQGKIESARVSIINRTKNLLWKSPARKVASLGTVALLIIVPTLVTWQKQRAERAAAIQRAEIEAAKPKKVSGQVYVVEDGNGVSLAGIQLQVFAKPADFEDLISRRSNEAKTNLAGLFEEQRKLRPELQDTGSVYELMAKLEAKQHILLGQCEEEVAMEQEALAEIASNSILQPYEAETKRGLGVQVAKRDQAKRDHDKTLGDLAAATILARKVRDWESPRIYSDLPLGSVITTATTDTGGRFEVELPKQGTFIIAAQASLVSEGLTNEYGWLAPIASDEAWVVLNNDNLLPSAGLNLQP